MPVPQHSVRVKGKETSERQLLVIRAFVVSLVGLGSSDHKWRGAETAVVG